MPLLLAIISVAVAVLFVALAKLSGRLAMLGLTSVIGGVIGVIVVVTHSFQRICDFARPVEVDTCSGTYVTLLGEHRLPQFMHAGHSTALLVGTAAFAGALLADLLALSLMWAWTRVKARVKGRHPAIVTPAQ
jgi:hypothetical protein